MSRYLVINSTTSAILKTISASDEDVALLQAGAGEAVMVMADDTGAFVDDALLEVDVATGAIVTISGGTTPDVFADLTLTELTA
jgi:hypothetical protein